MLGSELISRLKELAHAHELYHVTTYKGYRTKRSGATQDLQIEIWDMGEDGGDSRYHVVAMLGDGRPATYNSAPLLDVALLNVHWGDLDG